MAVCGFLSASQVLAIAFLSVDKAKILDSLLGTYSGGSHVRDGCLAPRVWLILSVLLMGCLDNVAASAQGAPDYTNGAKTTDAIYVTCLKGTRETLGKNLDAYYRMVFADSPYSTVRGSRIQVQDPWHVQVAFELHDQVSGSGVHQFLANAAVAADGTIDVQTSLKGESTGSYKFTFCADGDRPADAAVAETTAPQNDINEGIAQLQAKEVARLRRIQIKLGNSSDDLTGVVAKQIIRNGIADKAIDNFVEDSKEKRVKYIENRPESALEYHNKRAIETNALYCKAWPDDRNCR